VLLTVKGFALQAAIDDLAPAVGSGTAILPVLNGMRHVQVLKDRFGEAAVGGCVCKCATTLDDNGRVVQLTKPQDLAYGEMDGRPTARIQALDAFMTGAGFDARLCSVIERERWEKWLMLASIGAIIAYAGQYRGGRGRLRRTRIRLWCDRRGGCDHFRRRRAAQP
jgi:2-dehydropantoate 2-reductase